MNNDVALPADGGALDAAFYAAKAARDFGSQIALQYKAVSPTHLVSSFVEGLTADGDVVSIGQLLENNKVTEWLARIGSSERQLRAAVNAARKVRRMQAVAATGVVVPPRRRKRPSDKQSMGD